MLILVENINSCLNRFKWIHKICSTGTHTHSNIDLYCIYTEIFLLHMKHLYEYLWQVLHLTKFDPIS